VEANPNGSSDDIAGVCDETGLVFGLMPHPAWFWAHYIGCLEFFGGLWLIPGLLTRPVAALFAGFMFVAAFHVHMQIGWFWTNRGMEVPFYFLLICLGILIRGGGPLSLDNRLGREI